MQKLFFGEIVIPVIELARRGFGDRVSPTNTYDNDFQTKPTVLLFTLYEKQPPERFLGSSHVGFTPLRIRKSMQFLTIFSGRVSHNAIASSIVEIVLISL
jgi:hypothetical protein